MTDRIPVGTVAGTEALAFVRAKGLNRHTFWCGQSGSGKTYALGVMLEQVLLRTRLPIVVLDPNSDFVRITEVLGEARSLGDARAEGAAGRAANAAAELRSRDIRVLHSVPGIGDDLTVSMLQMTDRTRAALLQLDPVRDAEEFNATLGLVADARSAGVPDQGALLAWLRESNDDVHRRLALRFENLGIDDWNLWARGRNAVTDVIDERPDAVVVDLGKFDTTVEPKITALAVLDHLWAQRHERIGRLVVIDEAHNLCPPDPVTEVERLLTDRIIQIAAEGRKYGIWLLLSTQRPSKVHINAVSQCDNLALMRMNSPAEIDELTRLFGFAPPELIARASAFRQGQALFAGKFMPEPAIVQMGERLTAEGGSDVEVPLRSGL